jgi:hypothetical protein
MIWKSEFHIYMYNSYFEHNIIRGAPILKYQSFETANITVNSFKKMFSWIRIFVDPLLWSLHIYSHLKFSKIINIICNADIITKT